MQMPFKLARPFFRRDEDDEFGNRPRKARFIAQRRTELLPFVCEVGVVQRRHQWTLDFPARAGDDGVEHLALLHTKPIGRV